MASSNKTDKLQLPQWQLSDKPEMSDFNDAFNKVEDFKDEFDSHLAENADNDVHDLKKDGAIIVESYTSGSIFVTKYANGKMELFGRVRNINGENTETTFPEPFYGNTAPIVLATARRAGGYNDLNVMTKSYSTTTNGVQFYVTRTSGELPSDIDIDYMAIGKWK